MRRTAALALALCLLLCSACGGVEVDITTAPEHTAAPVPTPGPSPSPTPEPTPTPEPGEMVRVVDIIPDIRLDIRYTAAENFTGEVIYESAEAYLRRGTAEKLSKVQDELEELSYSLTIWDAWRPIAAQFALWRACPDARYVADPFNGFSGHCRGNTVDITITTLDGEPVELPSGFDDFSALADRDYSDVSETAAANARLLEDAMTRAGFTGYSAEWWHYTDTDAYDVVEALEPLPMAEADCEEFISLRAAPDVGAEALATAPAGAELYVLDEVGEFSLVRYGEQYGYALTAYLRPAV